MQKKYIKTIAKIGLGGSLSLILGPLALQSCRTADNEDGSYDVEEKYTQGVKTYIKETEPGKFKITDEIQVAADSSKAIVTYLDGRVETLNAEQSKNLIDKEIAQNGSQIGQGFGLGNALLYGGMGYLLARTLSPGFGRYRNDIPREDERRGGASTVARTAAAKKYYADDKTYTKSTQVQDNIGKSRTMVASPRSSKSGFFGRSSRGGGFGG
jgi:hypothetical protein